MHTPVHSVALWASVPITIPAGWTWGPWDEKPLGTEPVASSREVAKVLRAFAQAAALVIRGADRYIITAYGTQSGHVYGRDQWQWDQRTRVYIPAGEPWCPRLVPGQAIDSLAPM